MVECLAIQMLDLSQNSTANDNLSVVMSGTYEKGYFYKVPKHKLGIFIYT